MKRKISIFVLFTVLMTITYAAGQANTLIAENGRATIRLAAISGPAEGLQVDIEEDIFSIGADPGNDLDLTVDDYVSGQHASIRYEEGNFLILG